MGIFVDIEKNLGDFQLKVQFAAENETLGILGASGCGKTMTLKCIAGIEKPDRGTIILGDRVLFDSEKKINLPPQKRKTGLLFQNYALFPNMTVEQNIQAGVRKKKQKKEQKDAVQQMMEVFELTAYAKQYPSHLSGGQQQRTALARALISEPEILLLDEPFSALDSHLRLKTEQEVKKVIENFGKTVLFVSHDRDEVFRMSEKIALMNRGGIDHIGSKKSVFADPKTKEGTILTGCKNISFVKTVGEREILAVDWGIRLKVEKDPSQVRYLGIRAHDLQLGVGENTIRCEILQVVENPFSYTVFLRAADQKDASLLLWEADKKEWTPGDKKWIDIQILPERMILLKE